MKKKAIIPGLDETDPEQVEPVDTLTDENNDDLINNKKLLDIVKNYRIDKLTVTHHTKDDTYDVSFSTLSRSQERNQKAMEAQQNGLPQQQDLEMPEVPEVPEAPAEPVVPKPATASAKIVVRVADQLKPKPKPDLKALASKYPRKYLKQMGIIASTTHG